MLVSSNRESLAFKKIFFITLVLIIVFLILVNYFLIPFLNYSVEDIDDKNASLYKCNYRDNYNSHEIVFSKKITVLEKESINYKQGDIFNYSKNIYHSIYKLNANYVDSLILCGITVEPTANIISFDDISSLSGSNKYLSSDHLKT